MSPAQSYRRLYPHVHQPDGGLTRFAGLLIAGLVGIVFRPIGFTAMVAYVVAGPDGMLSRIRVAEDSDQAHHDVDRTGDSASG